MKSHKSYNFKTIAIAGTFDRLHKGHRYFIRQAFKLGRKVLIGLTSDGYVKGKSKIKNQKSKIHIKYQKYEDRKRELEGFLRKEGLLGRAEIVKIEDVYGPAIRRAGRLEDEIEALVVTEETYKGGVEVNRKREELGLSPLKLLKLPMILAQDNKRIASTRIRIGEIDRWGRVFQNQISNIKYQISNELRNELKKPMGKLIKGNPDDLKVAAEELKNAIVTINPVLISTVGDEVTKLCNEVGIAIHLAIIDFKVHREEKYHSLSELGFLKKEASKTPQGWQAGSHDSPGVEESTRVKNPPGHITKELVEAVKNAYLGIIRDDKQRIIQVDGEEDLAGVPAILLAPLGALVLYGQPGRGVVLVEVIEEKKQELLNLLEFYPSSKP